MQEIQSVHQQNQRFMQDVHTLVLTKRQLERELADLRGGNQASEDDGISQASPEKRSLVDKAREIICQTKAMNAELDRQAGAKMEGLQQLTPSLKPHDTDFMQPLIKEQSVLQETVQKKRASDTDDRVDVKGRKDKSRELKNQDS